MASLAGMLAERGFRVTGSDAAAYPPMSDFLHSLGIPISQPFSALNLEPTPDLVVVGNAISRGNVELEHVLDQRIPFCSLPQLLHDEFLRGKEVLVVAGTHGKTTTTSMLAWIFEYAGAHPSFLIGGIAENFGRSFQLGDGKEFNPPPRPRCPSESSPSTPAKASNAVLRVRSARLSVTAQPPVPHGKLLT